jgi:hypothetical protein
MKVMVFFVLFCWVVKLIGHFRNFVDCSFLSALSINGYVND